MIFTDVQNSEAVRGAKIWYHSEFELAVGSQRSNGLQVLLPAVKMVREWGKDLRYDYWWALNIEVLVGIFGMLVLASSLACHP